ncbi:MAG: helix-turn-helix domain-containing protein [Candidatus Dormibacterales bacterium]
MPRTTETSPGWLSLDEAARRLSIHPATLREWADKGRIHTVRTPGGHRRFAAADVAAIGTPTAPDFSLFLNATVGHARLAASGGLLASESWYGRFDESAKNAQRQLGTDLVQALVAFLAKPDRGWTGEIHGLGHRYADLARSVGLSVGDAMRAFHLFDGLVRSSVEQVTAAHVAGDPDLERHVGWFLNEVRVAMVECLTDETA